MFFLRTALSSYTRPLRKSEKHSLVVFGNGSISQSTKGVRTV